MLGSRDATLSRRRPACIALCAGGCSAYAGAIHRGSAYSRAVRSRWRKSAPQRFAFEFRDASWLCPEVFALLESAGAALCLPVSPTVLLDVRLTAPWTYIRFHGGQHGIAFADEELRLWADRIRGFRTAYAADTYVYFNNDPEGHALRDAERLRALLT